MTPAPSIPPRAFPSPLAPPRPRAHPRGVIYLAVVSICSMAAALALGAMTLASTNAKVARLRGDSAEAQAAALSGVEYALTYMSRTPTWRTGRGAGNWLSQSALGRAKVTLAVTDPSGPIADSDLDPVVIDAAATVRTCTRRVRVTVLPTSRGLDSLAYTAASGSDVTYALFSNTTSTAAIAGNAGASALLATVNTELHLAGNATGATFRSKVTERTAAVTIPTFAAASAWYIQHGTPIAASTINKSGSIKIDRQLISHACNPWGIPDPRGIYIIDCANRDIEISDSRLVGTLILKNVGTTTIYGSVRAVPAVTGYPVLVVDGGLAISISSSSLSESSGGENVNFNPPGTPYPYPGGSTDNDTSDSYPTGLYGLIYADGNISISGSKVQNVLCTGKLAFSGTTTLSGTGSAITTPPPGFFTTDMVPTANSWQEVR
ncbi:hypothetical protein BH11PLA1_BH11PLA1_09970 [soil metagenome]